MYNQQGIFTIGSDMCYVNKIMHDETLPRSCMAENPLNNSDIEGGVVYDQHMQPKARKKRKFKFNYTHLLNFIYFIIAHIFILGVEFAFIPGRKTGFYCKDEKISRTFSDDTISNTSLLITSLLMPVLIIALNEGAKFSWRPKLFLNRTIKWFYLYFIFITLMLVIIQACKSFAAELRPHFLSSCQPDVAKNCTEGQYMTDYICTNKVLGRRFLIDTERSFPSGHASISMYATVFTAIYIHYQLEVLKLGSLLKPFMLACVCLWGPMVSISRVIDNRHFWWDVLAGGILGVGCAFYAMFSASHYVKDNKGKPRAKSYLENSSTTALYDVKNINPNNSL